MRAILPAGGRAERFGGVVKDLLPIGDGETLLSAAIARARALGADAVTVVTSAEKAALHERYLAGRDVQLVVSSGRGLWGAVRAALAPEPGLLILPDTVWRVVSSIPPAPLAFGVFETDEAWRYSVWVGETLVTKPAGMTHGCAWGCVAWQAEVARWWLARDDADYDDALSVAAQQFGAARFSIADYHDMASWTHYRRYLEGV